MRSTPLILLLLLVCQLLGYAQKSPLKWVDRSYNFGIVDSWDNPPAIFEFTNTGNKPVIFLPIFYERDIYVELPQKSIEPGEKGYLTVYYYTSKTGIFSRKIPLYINVSADPIDLSVKGTIKSIYANALTACPTFGNKVPEPKASEQHPIVVIDRITRDPIETAMVEVRRKSRPEFRGFTNDRGLVDGKLGVGNTYTIESRKTGYITVEEEVYVNKGSGWIIVEMEPIREEEPIAQVEERPTPRPEPIEQPEPEPVYEEPIITSNINDQYDEPNIKEVVEARLEEAAAEPEPIVDEPEVDDGLLSRKMYSANNIVFLVDVSGSMRHDQKLDMLKTSIKQLVNVLREIDNVTLITYSTTTNELVPTTKADEKHYIKELIDSLKPGGWTNGVLGLQEAYESVEKHFLKHGNNQIILATDGEFNSSSFSQDDLMDMIKEKSDANIKLSVVGFGQKESAQRMMRRMANKGNGSYMQILQGQNNLDLLVDEIKTNSRIN